SDNEQAPALTKAHSAGISTEIVTANKGEKRESYGEKLIQALSSFKPDLIVLAGFMRIVGTNVIDAYKNKIINIHPSLLPAFAGLDVQKQALDYGVRFSGCTVHFVDAGCDTGPIILQTVVPILEGDTVETLSARILIEEHKLLPKAVDLIAQNKVKIENRKISIGG
ncbi:MAG: hypothetical protein ACD_73C00227G0002, partial [uncultured bacterium]